MNYLPWRVRYFFRCLMSGEDVVASIHFLLAADLDLTLGERLQFLREIYRISYRVWCAHTQAEILAVSSAVLRVPRNTSGVVVEAGCYKGGSTAKLSLIAKLTGRQLVAFDSFEGLPSNDEKHGRSIDGMVADFHAGAYEGSLGEVTDNVRRYGCLENTRFVKGWFSDTMVSFKDPVVGAFIDVDLVSSTRDCLKYLVPRLAPGAAIYSQDGHLPLVIEALRSDEFWKREIGLPKARMEGLGSRKLVRIERSD